SRSTTAGWLTTVTPRWPTRTRWRSILELTWSISRFRMSAENPSSGSWRHADPNGAPELRSSHPCTALHHEPDLPERVHVVCGIALDRHEVGEQAWGDAAQPIVQAEHLGADAGGRPERGERRHAVLHHVLELAHVVAMREH